MHPTEGLIDLPIVVDLLQTARAVAEAGEPRDIRGAQAGCSAVPVRIGDSQILSDGGELGVGVVDALNHARITETKLVILSGPKRPAITEHRLLTGDDHAARPPRSRAHCGLRQIARIKCIGVLPTE